MFNTIDEYISSIYSQWRLTLHYQNYEKFLKCFELRKKEHRDTGGSIVKYCEEYTYPDEVDPDKEFINFISNNVSNMPFKNIKFEKSWWVDYPKYSYAGLHTHQPGKQFTAIMFLNTLEHDVDNPHAGYLHTIAYNNGQMVYNDYQPIAGNVVVIDGPIWHGTYPTLKDRKVFVCDFSYEINGD